MRILSFGHLPTWAGGRQESGLANVIYQLAKHGSEIPDNEVFLAATDYYKSIRKDGRLTILGWTKIMLMVYILTRPNIPWKVTIIPTASGIISIYHID